MSRIEGRLVVSLPLHLVALPPVTAPPGPPAVLVALHGYAMDAPTMLDLVTRFSPPGFLVLSLQGPHTTLVPGTEGGTRRSAFHWGVAPDPEENRASHRDAVAAAVRWAIDQGGDPARVSLAGFSQPCSFNYRLGLDPPHGHPFRTIVSFCGGVPGEWKKDEGDGTAASKFTSVLHVSTREDPFYPLDGVAAFPAILERRFRSVRHVLHDGGHRIPSAANEETRAFLMENG